MSPLAVFKLASFRRSFGDPDERQPNPAYESTRRSWRASPRTVAGRKIKSNRRPVIAERDSSLYRAHRPHSDLLPFSVDRNESFHDGVNNLCILDKQSCTRGYPYRPYSPTTVLSRGSLVFDASALASWDIESPCHRELDIVLASQTPGTFRGVHRDGMDMQRLTSRLGGGGAPEEYTKVSHPVSVGSLWSRMA
jgi:hypothetical protein